MNHDDAYLAMLTHINEPSLHGRTERWFDTLEILNSDGTETDFEAVTVESSEDEEPYLDALAAAGWRVLGDAPRSAKGGMGEGGYIVERVKA
jgi:hypothetical protein